MENKMESNGMKRRGFLRTTGFAVGALFLPFWRNKVFGAMEAKVPYPL